MADYRMMQSGYQSYHQRRSAAELETRQREELMSQRFAPNVREWGLGVSG